MADDRVPLSIGQWVEIRSKLTGELVAAGDIMELVPSAGVVRVTDRMSGSDLQIDVDPSEYDVWIVERDVVGDAPGSRVGGRF